MAVREDIPCPTGDVCADKGRASPVASPLTSRARPPMPPSRPRCWRWSGSPPRPSSASPSVLSCVSGPGSTPASTEHPCLSARPPAGPPAPPGAQPHLKLGPVHGHPGAAGAAEPPEILLRVREADGLLQLPVHVGVAAGRGAGWVLQVGQDPGGCPGDGVGQEHAQTVSLGRQAPAQPSCHPATSQGPSCWPEATGAAQPGSSRSPQGLGSTRTPRAAAPTCCSRPGSGAS